MTKKFFAKFLISTIIFSVWTTSLAQAPKKVASNVKSASFGNIEAITAKQLKDYLTFIASDELEGRDTPSRGLDIAAKFIASHLSTWGIKPAANDGTYFQKIPLVRKKINSAESRIELGDQTYSYGDDFLAQSFAGSAEGHLIFVGNGWFIKSKNINAYQNIDVKGKIVVTTNTFPKGTGFDDLKGKPGVDWASPGIYAQQHGAKAIINLPSFNGLLNWQTNRQNQIEKGSVDRAWQDNTGNAAIRSAIIPIITASPKLAAAIFQGEKSSGGNLIGRAWAGEAIDGFDLKPEKKIKITVGVSAKPESTQNVVGILEGSDPILKNEYVVIGAHYDHVGVGSPVNGDTIYNGADDDGSGTVSVMAIAEALSKGTPFPKRSVLFIWHAAEEKGLWGSEYFADHPVIPINSIITQLNVDMIGRAQKPGDENHPQNKEMAKPGEIFVVGSRMMSTELGALSESVNKSFLNMSFNYKYDAPDDPEQIFYRSDHYNYAKKGIPIIFYSDGVYDDYHQPSDEIEKINFEQMEKVARTIMATAWELANRPTRPKVDKQLPAQTAEN
jgi:hypothetical protein